MKTLFCYSCVIIAFVGVLFLLMKGASDAGDATRLKDSQIVKIGGLERVYDPEFNTLCYQTAGGKLSCVQLEKKQ